VVPIEHTRYREIAVESRGISDVADKRVHIGCVGREPSWVKVADYSGGVDEVAVARSVSFVPWG
jgi:hypothetical protein